MERITMANTKENTKVNDKMELATVSMADDFAIVEAGTGAAIRATTTDKTSVLFNAVNGQGQKVKDFIGVELNVVNIVVTSADVAKDFFNKDNPDVEKVSKPCCHFFTADGLHISSISNGITRAVMKLFECGLQPVDGEPVKMMFTTMETKNGTAHSLTLL